MSTKQELLAGRYTDGTLVHQSARWLARRLDARLAAGQARSDAAWRQVIVKAIWEHASFHLDDASGRRHWERMPSWIGSNYNNANEATGQPHFAEAFMDGREFNLSVLAGDRGPQVLSPAEIDFGDYPVDKPRIVGYRAKWDEAVV